MERVIYSKCSTERKKEYKILTSIIDIDGKRVVRKSAAVPMARKHVNKIIDYYNMGEKYLVSNVVNAPCKKVNDGCVEFKYIEGISYAEKVKLISETGDMKQLEECIAEIRDIIVRVSEIEPFSTSEEFEKLFGEQEWLKGTASAKNLNIDLLAENIIISDDIKYIIDYELTYSFNIPLKYVVFRMLFFNPTISSLGEEQRNKIYQACDISKEEWERFYAMELIFQMNLSGNSLDEVKKRIGMNTYLFSQNNQIISELRYCIFSDNGFLLDEGSYYGNELKLKFNVENFREISLKLNFDTCSIKILSSNAKVIYSNEAMMVGNDRFYLEKPILKFDVDGKDELEVDINILNENNPLINPFSVYVGKCNEIQATLLKKGDEISELVQKINLLTKDILQLGEERNKYVVQIGQLNNSIADLQDKYNRYAERSDRMISELGYELSKIKSAKDFEKFAKKNKLYEG